uniref:AC transposase n=1 Tax=Hordeum vulgare subsp. vulgare TaxID=112509 RepID=A0A8I6XTA3_HORVV
MGLWTFNPALARRELMRMIVLHELAFSLVACDGFRRFVSSLNPNFKMICRKTVKDDCMKAFKEEKRILQGMFQNSKSKISLTTDLWTSNQTVGYICITAHFLDEEWKPHKRIVKLAAMETPHTGAAMFNIMVNFVREWNIGDNLFAVTLDNASNNGAMMKLLRKHLLLKNMLVGGGKLFHQRCASHVINLICQAGLNFLGPVINLIRGSVKYIRSSPSRKEKFQEIIQQHGVQCRKTPSLDVPTRWNSTYMMIDIAKEYRGVFDSLIRLKRIYNF